MISHWRWQNAVTSPVTGAPAFTRVKLRRFPIKWYRLIGKNCAPLQGALIALSPNRARNAVSHRASPTCGPPLPTPQLERGSDPPVHKKRMPVDETGSIGRQKHCRPNQLRQLPPTALRGSL